MHSPLTMTAITLGMTLMVTSSTEHLRSPFDDGTRSDGSMVCGWCAPCDFYSSYAVLGPYTPDLGPISCPGGACGPCISADDGMTQLELTETIVKLRQAISEGRGGQVLSVLDRFNGEFAYDPARAQLNIASCDGTVVAAVLRVTPGTTLAQTLAGSLPLAE